MPDLIIATQSTYKLELFSRLGIPFEGRGAYIDESALPGESPVKTARRLARQKAEAIAQEFPHAAVLGADQVVFWDDRVLSKPGTKHAAVEQLCFLSGRVHTLLSAIALRMPDGSFFEAECAFKMHMRTLSREQLEAYVDADLPLDCAGAYKVEERGIRLFSRMEGDDFTSIIGLPLTRVVDVLESAGFHV